MGFDSKVTIRKAKISPIGCYIEGKELLGSQYGLFLGICLVGLLIGGAVPLVLYGPAFCGIALCYIKLAKGEQVAFEHLFKGFDYFVQGLIATLVYIGVTMLLIIPYSILFFILVAAMATEQAILMLVAGVLLAVVYASWFLLIGLASMVFMFASFLIVDKKMDGWPAMKLAFQGTMKNFWGLLAYAIVGQIAVIIGAIMCIVPAFLMIPILFAGHFVTYRKIFGLEKSAPVMAEPIHY